MTQKTKLPERLYYPIALAAEKLGCTVDDLIHFGTTGQVEICCFMKMRVYGVSAAWLTDGAVQIKGFYCTMQISEALARGERSAVAFGLFALPCRMLRNWDLNIDEDPDYRAKLKTPAHNFDEKEVEFTMAVQPERDDLPLYLTAHEIGKLTGKPFSSDVHVFAEELPEHARTANRKGSVISTLLKLIPDFDGVDIDTAPVSKLINMVESLAANKGIEFDSPDKNTWSRYLGRK
ncbi:hypothetical protein [Kosakonia sp. R1.Fl]|uniref:hypothetical protein n=1 Tax=Kosakonia sp. R1.Fl TaxID=2928706 RepID=UPI00201D669C|nr:hypothetical protein [Kosakonia sp. R1.Fl]MCL6742798.1 hypothetical protein [Kosakonia sp. R1.Fl]